jgi:hypothetical protein
MTMTRDGWSVPVLARRRPSAFPLQCSLIESELPGRRRIWWTVWHRPAQASALVCGEGYIGGRRWWSRSRPRGVVMTMTPDCNLDGAFLLDGVCAFLCGLPGHLVCLIFVGVL